MSHSKSHEERLERVNRCLLELSPDFAANATRLTALAGDLFRARMALFTRHNGTQSETVGRWQVPDEFPSFLPAEVTLGCEVSRLNREEWLCLPDLAQTRLAATLPHLALLRLKSFVGHLVRCRGEAAGTLCLFFKRRFRPTENDRRLLGILASALGVEENRRQAEEALRESEERYRRIVETANEGIWCLDSTSRTSFVNRRIEEMLGYRAAEMIGRPLEEFLRPEDVEDHHTQFVARTTGQPGHFERWYRHASGQWRWMRVSATPLFDASGRFLGSFAMFTDMTERKRAEMSLRESEERFRITAQMTGEVIYDCDVATGRITWAGAVERVTGFTEEQFADVDLKACEALIHPDDRRRTIDTRTHALSNLSAYHVDYRFRRKEGSYILIEDQGVVLPGQDGHPQRVLGTMNNISARHQAEVDRLEMERRLMHAQKLESLGVLAGGIAHDFNNLLTVILGNLELALLDVDDSSSAQVTVQQAVAATRRAADLTRQMLAYSGRGRFVVRPIDLSATIQEMVQLLRVSIGRAAVLNLEVDPHLPSVHADSAQIQQIIMNLVTNAAEAIGDAEGSVTVRTRVRDCDEACLAESCLAEKPRPGRYVVLEVIDDGCGMSEEVQQRLFDPFFSTKFTGRGLGMSVVMGVVRGHGGAILVSSQAGRGTSVQVLFPASLQKPVASGPTPETSPNLDEPSLHAGPTRTVLVVDDEEAVCALAAEVLQQSGYRVLTSADGKEALQLYSEHRGQIAGVVLDMTMPIMDGMETFLKLKELDPDVRVILASGCDAQTIQDRFAGKGIRDFIQKPFSLQALRTAVGRLCAPAR